MVQYHIKKVYVGETNKINYMFVKKTNTSDMANSKMAKITKTNILIPIEKPCLKK